MSLFGRALAGFGQGASQLANKWINEEVQQQRAQFMADLQMKQAKDREEWEQSPEVQGRRTTNATTRALAEAKTTDQITMDRAANEPLNTALRGKEAADAKARATTAREVELERLTDKPLMTAARDKARDDAVSQAETQADLAKRMAADADYLKAQKTIKLNDPEVAARIEQSRAAAANSFAAAKQHNASTDGIKQINAERERLNAIYDRADALLVDESLSDAERKSKLDTLMKQATLIKSKNAAPGQRDPELDTVTVTEEKLDPKTGATVKTTRKEVRRPGQGGDGQGAQDPAAQIRSGIEQARKDGKIGDAIEEMRKRGASQEMMRAAGITESELTAASQPKSKPAGPTKEEWRPDPDSPAGKRRALMESNRERQQQGDVNEPVRRAVAEDQAKELLSNGDKKALFKFQSSPAFADLSFETKARIAALINSR